MSLGLYFYYSHTFEIEKGDGLMNLSIIGQVLRVLVGYNKSLGTKVIMGILLILTGTGIYSLFTGYPNMEVIMSLIKIVTDVLVPTGS